MAQFLRSILNRWPLWALGSSALMLAAAHAFETIGGLAPCTLCLRQREVYWVAGTVALVAFVLSRLPRQRRWVPLLNLALGLIFLTGVGVASYHAGAEWGFWPGPSTCSGGGGVSLDDMTAFVNGAQIKPPACDKAAWVFMGLSMAGWNVLVSLKLALYSLAAAYSGRRA